MKKIIVFIISFMFFATAIFSKVAYQIVDVYVCQTGRDMANLQAKASVSRKELYRVSYCTCQGVSSNLKVKVKDNSCKTNKQVYSCVCIGTSGY